MAATKAQLNYNRIAKQVVTGNGGTYWTLKHRALEGTVTNVAGTNNKVYKGVQASTALPTTTDSSVWVTVEPGRMRSSQSDAGDSPAGRANTPRARCQISAVDINNSAVTVSDEDWLIGPDGTMFKIENPVINTTGVYYTAEMIRQR